MSMISEQVKRLRKLAKEWVRTNVTVYQEFTDAANTIETLSAKVRANNLHGGWIPVSERLPELKYEYDDCGIAFKYSENVLVKLKRGSFLECDESIEVMHLSDDMNGKDFYWCSYDDDANFDEVLAWMPLPEPWGGKQE